VQPLSAVQAVTPAFEQTKQQLFKPFRFWHWGRLALVALVTGEFAGGGGGGGGGSARFPVPEPVETKDLAWLATSGPTWARIVEYLPLILLAIGLVIALGLLWLYVASVCRFILLDTVIKNRCELRAGWRRWQPQGKSYFLWSIALGLAVLAALLLTIGGPVFLAWQAGIFREPKQHLVLLILGGVVLFFLFIGLIVAGAVVALLAKDFAVPIMALENRGITDAWQRLLPMLATEKLSFAGYVLMKIVLAVGSAILFGILSLLALLLLLVPLGIGGLAIYLLAKGLGLVWNFVTIGAVAVLAVAILLFILLIVAFISVPAVVFFQSYPLNFFGSRYPVLAALGFPPPPPPAPATLQPTPEPAA